MTVLRPPRREPRALALVRVERGIAFAVCDPWELRSCGIQLCHASSRGLAIRRLIRREKPTVVVCRAPELLRAAGHVTRRIGIPVIRGRIEIPPLECAKDLLRHMAYQAPTPVLQEAVRLALATALSPDETHRTYAPRNRSILRRAA